MIIDKMCNIRNYESLLPGLSKALECVDNIKDYTPGRVDFEGGFILIQKGTTQSFERGLYEAHRDYIDVQIVVEGSEEVAWAHLDELTTAKPYEPDAELLDGPRGLIFKVMPDTFYAVFPSDGHMPCRHTSTPQDYTKLVLKLKM